MLTLSYHLSYIRFTFSKISPTCSLFSSVSTTNIVCRSLGSGGYAKSYDQIDPQPPDMTNMTTTMYPATSNISANHHYSGDVSIITPRHLQQIPPPPTSGIILKAFTLSGINNLFSCLLFFISYLLILELNTKK